MLGAAQLISGAPGSDQLYPTQLAGTTVEFDGTPAPLIYAWSTQVSEGVLDEVENWRRLSVDTRDDAWVFPSERLTTPLSKDNCWRRHMEPNLKKAGLEWANFQVMRRTHATLMKTLGVDGKLVADQLGHTLDVNQNIYTQSPVESRLDMVNKLEKSLLVM